MVHLIATEAHAPSRGDGVVRVDLEVEALRLARLLVELMPGEPEVLSLLALPLSPLPAARARRRQRGAGAARRPGPVQVGPRRGRGRIGAAGRGGAPLRWRRRALPAAGPPGRVSLHRTDMARHRRNRIIGIYDLLLTWSANPAVALNRAVALDERDGPRPGWPRSMPWPDCPARTCGTRCGPCRSAGSQRPRGARGAPGRSRAGAHRPGPAASRTAARRPCRSDRRRRRQLTGPYCAGLLRTPASPRGREATHNGVDSGDGDAVRGEPLR